MVILWESGEIQKYLQKYQFVFPNPQSIGISLPNFFQRSTSNGVSHVREPKTDTGTFSQKIKKLGPHFIFPTHFLMPQGLINPEFSTQKMMSSWNFHKKWNSKHFNFLFGEYQPRGVHL